MNISDKRKALVDYCNRIKCRDCKLNNCGVWIVPYVYGRNHCLQIDESPEADLDKALAILGITEADEVDCHLCKYWPEEYNDTYCKGCKNHIFHGSPEYEIAPIKFVPAGEDDPVNHPAHYTSGGIECLDAIKASMDPAGYADFLKGQVLKYLWRYRLKGNPLQDLQKARFYLDRLISETEAAT